MFELLNPMRYLPESWLASLGARQGPPPPDPDPAMRQLNQVVGAFGSRLLVEQVGGSYVISLSFMSEDPAKAASIANAHAAQAARETRTVSCRPRAWSAPGQRVRREALGVSFPADGAAPPQA